VGRKILNIELSADKRRLLENFFSLLVLQGANYILPLITLPYLVRVLGPEKFGLIAFAQAFIQYFNILTDYGFSLSATREVSIHRDNKEKLSEIFSSVMIIKFALLILSFMIMTIIVFSFEKFKKDWLVYYLTFGVTIGQVLFPVWFFQGMERMKYITIIEFSIRIFFIVLIFCFIHNVSDFWKVPLLRSLGYILGGLLSIWIVFKEFKINFAFKINIDYFKRSNILFFSQASTTLFNEIVTLLGGFFFNYMLLGYYKIAENLFVAIRNLFGICFRTMYPYFSKNINEFEKSKKKVFISVLFLSFFVSIISIISSRKVIFILFNFNNDIIIKIFITLAIALFFSGNNIMFFTMWFLILRLDKIFFKIVTVGGILNIILILSFTFIFKFGILSLSSSILGTEMFLTFMYIVVFLKKSKVYQITNG